MTLPSSGPLTLAQINAEFGRGLNLNAYRGTQWWLDNGTTGTFPTGAISFSDFYSKRGTSPVTPGNADYGTPGTYNFIVPSFNSLTVQVWGGGGGGGAFEYAGASGGTSQFNGVYGYGGGGAGASVFGGGPGGGGGAAGGTTNTSGSAGSSTNGGNSPSGGVGGGPGGTSGGPGSAGGFPGGGGGAATFESCDKFGCTTSYAGGGGGGGYATRTWSAGELTPGASISLVVASGGAGGSGFGYFSGGSGANGRVYISWS